MDVRVNCPEDNFDRPCTVENSNDAACVHETNSNTTSNLLGDTFHRFTDDLTGLTAGNPAPSTTAGMTRWSSEPASLSSSTEDASTVTGDLLERTSRAIVTLQHDLATKTERIRTLESELSTERTRNHSTSFEMIARYIEQDRSEIRQLTATIRQQKKLISKLRRRLRETEARLAAGCLLSGAADAENRVDGDSSDDEKGVAGVVFASKECETERVAGHADRKHFQKHRRALSDFSASQRNPSLPNNLEYTTVEQTSGNGISHNHHTAPIAMRTNDDSATLSRRLRDTVKICQKLAQKLEVQNSTGNVVSASGMLVVGQAPTSSSANDAEIADGSYKDQLIAARKKLEEVEAMNERWQRYMEQRDEYTRSLEQRCSELVLHGSKFGSVGSSLELTPEQQERVDRAILEQRQKTEIAEEARSRLETEVTQLRMKCRQQEVCINQLVSKLKEIDGIRRSEKEMFNAQLTVYRDDFASEQVDRHRAQERVVKLEQQLNTVMQRLMRYEPTSLRDMITSSNFRRSRCDSLSSSNNSHHDGSLQLLVGRGGCGSDSDYHDRPDTPPHSH